MNWRCHVVCDRVQCDRVECDRVKCDRVYCSHNVAIEYLMNYVNYECKSETDLEQVGN